MGLCIAAGARYVIGESGKVVPERLGRVCWGRPLLSRPRGAVGFGLAAVESLESAAASVVVLTCGVCVVGGFGWL